MRQKIQTLFSSNQRFILFIVFLTLVALVVTHNYTLAMWFGFLVAGFSAVSNDSIQTLGAFLAANKKVAWYWLWLFVGGVMIFTVVTGWMTHGGDISYGRLNRIPQPTEIGFVHLLAPIFVIIFTRLKMPVSTTFLLLATFSSTNTVQGMVTKTATGYFLALGVAVLAWLAVSLVGKRYMKLGLGDKSSKVSPLWNILLWLSTGFLWASWLVQDNANAAVFLPRSLSLAELVIALGLLLSMLAFILKKRGGAIQTVVTEKTDVSYVKSATLINLVYGGILVYFTWLNDLPMSTTWVFLGLLAGREIILQLVMSKQRDYRQTMKLVGKDLLKATIGLAASIALAYVAKLF